MSMINVDGPKPGDRLVNLDEKVFPDHQASDGDRALIMMHTVPFEGSVGLVNMLTTMAPVSLWQQPDGVSPMLVKKGFQAIYR